MVVGNDAVRSVDQMPGILQDVTPRGIRDSYRLAPTLKIAIYELEGIQV